VVSFCVCVCVCVCDYVWRYHFNAVMSPCGHEWDSQFVLQCHFKRSLTTHSDFNAFVGWLLSGNNLHLQTTL
jgi:hypothetical protein